MMRVLLLAVLGIALTGCISMSHETQIKLSDKLQEVQALKTEQISLISKGAPVGSVSAKIDEGKRKLSEIYLICSDRDKVPRPYFSVCLTYWRSGMPTINAMELETARYIGARGDKEKAKNLLRQIIIDNPGPEGESLRQAAAFGLEDLKTAP